LIAQRIAAVKALEAMGYRFRDDKWLAPDATAGSPEADAMHALLVRCADQLEWRIEGSGENLVSRGVGLCEDRGWKRLTRFFTVGDARPGRPSVPRTMVGNVESKPHRAGILPYRGTGEPNGAPNCKAIAF
jgi:hypothetical protein